jgi:hypothetical protein
MRHDEDFETSYQFQIEESPGKQMAESCDARDGASRRGELT